MTSSSCEFPRAWLVSLRDGDLHAAQLEVTEAHLRACAECRRWMSEMDAVDRLLQDASPYRDNPLARAEIKARVATAPMRARPFSSSSGGPGLKALVATCAVLAVLVLAALPWRDDLIEASTGLERWLRDDSGRATPVSSELHATPIIAPTTFTGGIELPFGLAQAGRTEAGASSPCATIARFPASRSLTLLTVPIPVSSPHHGTTASARWPASTDSRSLWSMG